MQPVVRTFSCTTLFYSDSAVIIERRQAVIRPGAKAHHLRFVCVHRPRFPVGINSEPVEHGLQLVMDIGKQREVISKQQFWDSKASLAFSPGVRL